MLVLSGMHTAGGIEGTVVETITGLRAEAVAIGGASARPPRSPTSACVVGEMLGHKDVRTTQRYAHLANQVVRQGLEAATNRIIDSTRLPMLTLPPFERLTDREWKQIGPVVEATRGTCGGTRTNLRLAVGALGLAAIEVGREHRPTPRSGPRSKTPIDVPAVEVRPSTARQGRPSEFRQSA